MPYVIIVESDTYVDITRWSYIFSQEIIVQTESARRGWFACAQQQNRAIVPRKGTYSASINMYPYDYYPTYCSNYCYGMTREIVDRLFSQGILIKRLIIILIII